MADPLRSHGPRAPAERVRAVPNDGFYYPGEVADLLGLRDADYHQLRRLFKLAREQGGKAVPAASRTWSRYTLADIAAVSVALALCGGPGALAPGRRLRLAPLERACRALRASGVANPLLDVTLERRGLQIFATVDGVLFDPTTGQLAIAEVLRLLAPGLEHEPQGTELAARLTAESRRKPSRRTAPRATGLEPL